MVKGTQHQAFEEAYRESLKAAFHTLVNTIRDGDVETEEAAEQFKTNVAMSEQALSIARGE